MGEKKVSASRFWAKSNAGGRPHSLIGHSLDSAAVAELIWERFLAQSSRGQLNDASGGRGRELFSLLAGFHDLGKATPAFQFMASDDDLLIPVRDARLDAGRSSISMRKRWPHPHGSVEIAERLFDGVNFSDWEWILPILDGHHGMFGQKPNKPASMRRLRDVHGSRHWTSWQMGLANQILQELDIDVRNLELRAPSLGVQLALAGYVSMADWIASSDLFPGVGLEEMSIGEARRRATEAWDALGFYEGWNPDDLIASPTDFSTRFSFEPRPLQRAAVVAANEMSTPGLMIIEGPMGVGKTECGLAVAEAFSRKFGANGLLFALPTQGTTDAMYSRVRSWSQELDPEIQVSLLHGKAMLNEEWRQQVETVSVGGICDTDEFGCDADTYGSSLSGQVVESKSAVPTAWLMGRHRGLLSPVAVATVDQVLWAATRTKYVALRHAGLFGHVLVIDEVHSYDVYMSVFLDDLLKWCARMRVPTILMSATLPPAVRQKLIEGWCAGAGLEPPEEGPDISYPLITSVDGSGEVNKHEVEVSVGELAVHIETLNSTNPESVEPIVELIADELSEGGLGLVICNTVSRAQEVWARLQSLGIDSLLLHGRFTAVERAERTREALRILGPRKGEVRRFVVVATQIAEQSFDADADLLVTDIAPVDLLVQRIGRLHRHRENDEFRPNRLSIPKAYISGVTFDAGGEPKFVDGFKYVYRESSLWEVAALVSQVDSLNLPSDIPKVVANAYSKSWLGPKSWEDSVSRLRSDEDGRERDREIRASAFVLRDSSASAADLWGLHDKPTTVSEDEWVVVRDGDETVEVSLVVCRKGELFTLSEGIPLGPEGRALRTWDSDRRGVLARGVLGDSVRIRLRHGMSIPTPYPEWSDVPLLASCPVLILDDQMTANLGRWQVSYDHELGLSVGWLEEEM